MASGYPVIEHGETRPSRWIRDNRLKVAFIVALVETALVIVDVIAWRWALLAAAVVFAFHYFVGRKARHESVRQLSWAAAVSQTLPVLVPFVVLLVGALLVLAVIVAAVVVLAFVVFGRR